MQSTSIGQKYWNFRIDYIDQVRIYSHLILRISHNFLLIYNFRIFMYKFKIQLMLVVILGIIIYVVVANL